MAIAAQPQTSLYEEVVENSLIEAALERRQEKKAKQATASKAYREADEAAKGHLAALDLEEGTSIRIGRFVVSKRDIAARQVAFETAPSSRLAIRLLSDDQLGI